jgi:GNAT superfamily N-acetyltransferase
LAYNTAVNLRYREFRGEALAEEIHGLGELRIRVFREWPYLYEGDLAYERNYLGTYLNSPTSFALLVYEDKNLIGATTAIELQDESGEFQAPFRARGIDPRKVVYFGESILLPQYRGQGVGKEFMRARIDYARSLPAKELAAFCAVIRSENHPDKPAGYRPLDEFWRGQGFAPEPGMVAEYQWKDLGESEESTKKLQFWLRPLKEKP